MKATLGAFVVGLLIAAPAASAQTLEEQLGELRFANITFSIGWSTDKDRPGGLVEVHANDLDVKGQGASELRMCLDGQECPMPEIAAAARGSNRDGEVDRTEVEDFRQLLKYGLAASDDVKQLRDNLKTALLVDNKPATSVSLTDVIIKNAEGDVDSQSPIHFYLVMTGRYANVPEAKTHAVKMNRAQTEFTIADEIVVRGGKNWRIVEASIQPESMLPFFSKGRFVGAQEDFESPEPLLFDIEYHKTSPGWGLLGAVAALGVALRLGRKL